jgi:N6-L-threonylcarbamoyladenine synthase
MKILAIETSCDDTGIAILDILKGTTPHFSVLANVVSSQQIHQNYGGVFPMMAKREHQTNLVPVLMQALQKAKLANPKSQILNPKQIQTLKKILEKENALFESTKKFLETHEKPDIDIIAVTHGPGLEPCLWVGVNFAKTLSYLWNIPVIPVNHIEAHILVNVLENPTINFPAISLIVSGGHTQLILVKKIGKYEIIGETRDDAAGECFDKCAKILGLGYPGGPIISKIASEPKKEVYFNNRRPSIIKVIPLPRPMMHSNDYDFSFSGLKTAVLYKLRDTKPETVKSKEFIQEMCYEVQQAICDVLIKKTLAAAKSYHVKTIILGGGVSANQELRRQLKEKIQQEIPTTKYLIPDSTLSTDNGLMIAVAGYFNQKEKTKSWKRLTVNANLRIGK